MTMREMVTGLSGFTFWQRIVADDKWFRVRPINKDAYLDPSWNLNCLSVMDIYRGLLVLFVASERGLSFLFAWTQHAHRRSIKEDPIFQPRDTTHTRRLFHYGSNYRDSFSFSTAREHAHRSCLFLSLVYGPRSCRNQTDRYDYLEWERKCSIRISFSRD